MAENFAINTDLDFATISCGSCGGVYAILERYRLSHYRNGTSWNCPYCQCGWGYAGNGENAKPKRLLEEKERDLNNQRKRTEWANEETRNAENRYRAQKAAKTRIKNRIANGVCPCCQRSFKNLHSHMKTKHPDYAGAGDKQ